MRHEHAASLIDRVRMAADGPDGGVRFLSAAGPAPSGVRDDIRCAVEPLGFVMVDPEQHGPPDAHAALLHRHVVLVAPAAADAGWAIRWTRQLAFTSPRRHLVVALFTPRCEEDGFCPAAPREPREPAAPAHRQLARAAVWRRRSRPRAAELWLGSAAAAARRRGRHSAAAEIELDLCRSLLDAGRASSATVRLRAILRAAELDWPAYAEAGALWASALIGAGAMSEARSWLSSLATEAALRGASPTAALEARDMEVTFWAGGGSATAAAITGAAASDDARGWQALCAWRHGALSTARARAADLAHAGEAGNPRARLWAAVLAVLLADPPGRPHEQMVLEKCLAVSSAPFRLAQLARGVLAWAWLGCGQPGRARDVARAAPGAGPESRLLTLLASRAAGEPIERRPDRDWPGLRCFTAGGTPVVSVDEVVALFRAVGEADEPRCALKAACQWAQRLAGDVRVGFVSGDGHRVLVAQGIRSVDEAGWIAPVPDDVSGRVVRDGAEREHAAPVRYGGAVVGYALMRGRPEDAGVLHEATRLLAAAAGPAVRATLDAMNQEELDRDCVPEILGRSAAIVDLKRAVARAAATAFPVVIEGESGTGKELAARALHRLSARRDRRFLAVNCAALTDELVESEFFGHAKGAFTGAIGPRAGLFEEAHGGTLFLDEVSELSPRAQAKLLRALQEREVRRVGESHGRPVDVRIVAASNVPLAQAVAQGRFRDDLRFRLAVVSLRVPPLRERIEDLPLLVQVFWRQAMADTGRRSVLAPEVLARLGGHGWPGNVRELQNVIAGLAVVAPERGRVTERHLPPWLAGAPASDAAEAVPLERARRGFERRVVAAALARHAGRRSGAARELGLTRQGLTKVLRRLGLGEDNAAGVA